MTHIALASIVYTPGIVLTLLGCISIYTHLFKRGERK